ncbi:MAG: hypothetical protein ABIJ52_15835 [Pseudomonadota bacterium]
MLNRKGFTLIGVIMILAVLAILVGMAIPFAFRLFEVSQKKETQEEMKKIRQAIVGSADLGTYGYVGDMGRFPANLGELNTRGSQPNYTTAGRISSVGMGWRGPYLNEGFYPASHLEDSWGNNYGYTVSTAPGPDGLMGTSDDVVTAKIQSYGPDKAPDTQDDLFAEEMTLKGKLRLKVTIGMTDNIPRSVDPKLYFADNGYECTTPLQGTMVTLPGEKGTWSYIDFAPVHHGVHALIVNMGNIQENVVVNITGGITSDTTVVVPIGVK